MIDGDEDDEMKVKSFAKSVMDKIYDENVVPNSVRNLERSMQLAYVKLMMKTMRGQPKNDIDDEYGQANPRMTSLG